MSQASLQVYRQLLRSAAKAFKGDKPMLTAALKEIRSKLELSKEVEDEAELQRLQAEGKEAADFLSTYIVQASINEKGNYAMSINEKQVNTFAEPIVEGMKIPRIKNTRDGPKTK